MPICCHFGAGMPYLHICVDEFVVSLGAMANKWVWNLFCGRNWKINNDQVKFAAKNIKATDLACEIFSKEGCYIWHCTVS